MRSSERAAAVPAARSEGLLVKPVGDETVIYDTESKQAHCPKPLAAVAFDCSDGKATISEIATIARQRLGEIVSDAEDADADQLRFSLPVAFELVLHQLLEAARGVDGTSGTRRGLRPTARRRSEAALNSSRQG
jgi:hypothetical protein